jgi:hypothetical protein
MITKYKPQLINETFPETLGVIMIPSSYGDYIKYFDYMVETINLKEINDALQRQCGILDIVNKDQRELLLKKEQEITILSDRLNELCLYK